MVKLLVVVLLFSFYLLAFGYWTKVKSNLMPFFDWFSIILIIAQNHNHFFLRMHVGACVYVPVNVYSNFILRWSHEPFENYLSSFRSKDQCALEPRSYQFICKIVLLKFLFVWTASKCIEMKRRVRILTWLLVHDRYALHTEAATNFNKIAFFEYRSLVQFYLFWALHLFSSRWTDTFVFPNKNETKQTS